MTLVMQEVEYFIRLFILCFILVFVTEKIKADEHASIIIPKPYSVISEQYFKILIANTDKPNYDSIQYELSFDRSYYKVPSKKFHSVIQYSVIINTQHLSDGLYFLRAILFYGTQRDTIPNSRISLGIPIIIDKTLSKKNVRCYSKYTNVKKERLDPFINQVENSFVNADNKISFYSWFDNDSLYINVYVSDQNLNTKPVFARYKLNNTYKIFSIWESDGIEICFDLNNNRSEWRSRDDIEIVYNLDDSIAFNCWDDTANIHYSWGKGIIINSKLYGSLNNNTDIDSGYTINVSIPRELLAKNISDSIVLGFDIQNFDLDIKEDKAIRASWSGTEFETNDNTSEWGLLVLKKDKNNIFLIFIIVLIFTFILVLYIIRKRLLVSKIKVNQKIEISEIVTSEEILEKKSHKIRQIKEYINTNFKNSEMRRIDIAKEFNLSETHLSNIFQKETGVHLNQYINEVRIERAKQLISEGKYNFSEVAFQCGYASVQHFYRTFKKITGVAPGNF